MIPIGVKEADFEFAELDEHMLLFTDLRLDRDTVPEGLHCYDVRDSDDLDGSVSEVKPFVMVNHWGTVLCKEPFPLDEHGSYYPKEDMNYICSMSLEEFVEATPEKLWELKDEVMPIRPEYMPTL